MGIEPYEVLCVQTNIHQVYLDKQGPPRLEAIDENLEHALKLIRGRIAPEWFGAPRLVVFPEFFLQGYTPGRSIQDWVRASIKVPGPVSDRIGQQARELGVYIAFNVWEVDDTWPDRFWDTTFIVDDQGDIILRYRKHSARLGYSYPGDALDEFIRRYGIEALFPVVDTPLGRLGAITCYDIHFPEVARCLAFNGAEVLIHCDGNPRGELYYTQAKDRAIRSRAWENTCYVITCKRAHWLDGDLPYDEGCGHSAIIGYSGQDISLADTSGECTIKAEIDVEALRRSRLKMGNSHAFLPQVQSDLFALYYQRAKLYPANRWLDRPIQTYQELRDVQQEVVESMEARGILTPPAGARPVEAGRR